MKTRPLTPSSDACHAPLQLQADEHQILEAFSSRPPPKTRIDWADSGLDLALPGNTGPWRLGRYERKRQRLLAGLSRGPVVLDVGHAAMPNPFLQAPGRTVVGIDVLRPDHAEGYDHHLVGDISSLRRLTGGQRFDCIIAGEFVEHLENPYEVIRSFAGALRPGGRLILSTPNPVSLPVVLFEWARSTRWFYDREHTFYFNPRWMVRLLERAGFCVEQQCGVGLWPWGLPCPVSWSYQVVYVATL